MSRPRVVIVGGGAAGFFAAIVCAEARPDASVVLLEKSAQVLAKVRISGGGRCNVTHACFEPRELTARYPRGGQALLGCFHAFQPRDTVAWFAARGVPLKTEDDGRMFPATNTSETIVECLRRSAQEAGVELRLNQAPPAATRAPGGGFDLALAGGGARHCERLLLATGGCRAAAAGELAVALGHTLEPPVPSLFTFHLGVPWLRALSGITLPAVEVSLAGFPRRETGPLLITHSGVSGPAVLRLSAWSARWLAEHGYQAMLRLNWLPGPAAGALDRELDARRKSQPARLVVNSPLAPLPARLWEGLVLAAGVPRDTRWANLSSAARHELARYLQAGEMPVTGKTLNQEEFVTCGGVRLSEVNFKTMESRICPGLHFAGELLDLDGLTGGFNFQAAWTTGWLAGRAMAAHGQGG